MQNDFEPRRKYIVLPHELHCPDCDACTSYECPYKKMLVAETEANYLSEHSGHADYLRRVSVVR